MKISDLVEKVDPFTLEFDGLKLNGTFYKWKTTTRNYRKGLQETVSELEAQLRLVRESQKAPDENTQKKIDELDDQIQRAGYSWLSDAIVSWDAVDDDDQPLKPSPEVFDKLPTPFLHRLTEYLETLRKENPTLPNSPSG